MRNNMDDSDIGEFEKFLDRVWGIKLEHEDEIVEENNEEIKNKKRGRKNKTVDE